jgi:hypothetical protein
MAITADTLRWHQSERMSDESDGGGQMSGTEIVSGQENQIFDDLSDVDRAAGDASIRKVYARVASPDADKYLDAGIVVWSPPADPDVSVLVFSTGDYYDERAAMKEKLESGISRGATWQGWLWGQHIAGQRAVTLWQRLSAKLPAIGQRMELVAWSGGAEQHSQVLWVTRVVSELVERNDTGGTYQVRSVVLELAEALRANYAGLEPQRMDPSAPATLVYDTRYNHGAVELVGVKPVALAAALGDYTVKVSGGLFQPLIPTALAETAIPDATPGGDAITLVPAADGTVSWTTTADAIGPGKALYLGGPVYPGTVSIGVSGSTLTDQGGAMLLAGSQIGTIDYSAGACLWAAGCPAYGTASKTVAYRPGAAPSRVADSAAQAVTVENRGYVWVMTLAPIPAPGTLRVAYRAENAWYVIAEDGGGSLRGADSSYGSGTLNFSTGTVTVTTGAMPDPESEILYTWGTPVAYTARGGDPVDAPVVRGTTAHPGVAPGTVEVEWTVGASTYTLTDNGSGALAGTGGSGEIVYATGAWWVRPTTVPPVGTEFAIAYDYGPPTVETFAGPTRNGEGNIPLTLAATPRAGSLQVEWPMELTDLADQWAIAEELIPPASRDPWSIIGGHW